MVDPRVAELVLEFIDRRVFENDLDAWRAAKSLIQELDRIAVGDREPRAAWETITWLDGDAACVRKLRPEDPRRRCEGLNQ